MKKNINVRSADLSDIDDVARLFDAYRVFYGKESDLVLARSFLSDRLQKKDSTLFIAELIEDEEIIGFVQLYPTFSSVSAKCAWILNDLFIEENFRRFGAAQKLMQYALAFCNKSGAAWVTLQTAQDNSQARNLYKKNGFIKENHYINYNFNF